METAKHYGLWPRDSMPEYVCLDTNALDLRVKSINNNTYQTQKMYL